MAPLRGSRFRAATKNIVRSRALWRSSASDVAFAHRRRHRARRAAALSLKHRASAAAAARQHGHQTCGQGERENEERASPRVPAAERGGIARRAAALILPACCCCAYRRRRHQCVPARFLARAHAPPCAIMARRACRRLSAAPSRFAPSQSRTSCGACVELYANMARGWLSRVATRRAASDIRAVAMRIFWCAWLAYGGISDNVE